MNNDQVIKSCFNCVHGKPESLDSGVPHEKIDCQNNNVDIELFGYLGEYELANYCNNHEFKQEADT